MKKAISVVLLFAAPLVYATPAPESITEGVDEVSTEIAHQAPTYLEQGWDKARRDEFYYTPQGSQLFPYAWFLALEQMGSKELFSEPTHLKKYGWVYSEPSKLNPDGLPVGFARDPDPHLAEGDKWKGTGQWVGLTCAACHTNNVVSNGKTIRVDGAPAMADFGQFLIDMSLTVTSNHPAINQKKFVRFAKRVLGNEAKKKDILLLGERYAAVATPFNGRAWMRTPPIPAGPGRVDALTQIINSLSVFYLIQPDNLHPPIAPVSYPFLWLTPKLEWVQWNPIAADPIARNVGEVLGVFGDADFESVKNGEINPDLFSSSALLKELYELEQWVDELQPPRWQEDVFGKIDRVQWKKGAKLFKKDCLGCHNMPTFGDGFKMTDPANNAFGKTFIQITAVPYEQVATDPIYIQSLISRFVETEQLSSVLFKDKQLLPAAKFFLGTVGAVLVRSFKENHLTDEQKVTYSGYRFRPVGYKQCGQGEPAEDIKPYEPCSVTSLKAGPLLGIWATAPFLHNGSVPNIYQLLSPAEERDKQFWVGSTYLDTTNLGFYKGESEYGELFNANLPGNSNKGHTYPQRGYSHEERMQVIEYLKDPELDKLAE